MPYKKYYAISFDDQTYGIWNKSKTSVFEKQGNNLRVEVFHEEDTFKGTVICEGSLSHVREYFKLNKINSDIECIDDDEPGFYLISLKK
jgi:hypothetical protein